MSTHPAQARLAPATGQPRFGLETVLEQGAGEFCEDRLLARDGLFAVFDGASSLDGRRFAGKSGAWWAAELASQAFAAGDAPLPALAGRANAAIAAGMERFGVERGDPCARWCAGFAAARLGPGRLEWAQIGDCLLLALRRDGSWFLPAPYHDHDRETLLAWRDAARAGAPDLFAALLPRIRAVRRGVNRAYGALDGEAAMRGFLRSGSLDLDGVAHVLLFSDGLHPPCADPARGADLGGLARGYLDHGLEGFKDRVRALECGDPGCRLYPRFKAHDDVAALALSFA